MNKIWKYFAYSNHLYQNGGVDNAISKWDAASSEISFSSASSSTAKLKIYAGEYSLPANVYGECTGTLWRPLDEIR